MDIVLRGEAIFQLDDPLASHMAPIKNKLIAQKSDLALPYLIIPIDRLSRPSLTLL